jgi:phosphatidylserine/phosphatidylglycerophosphate/cardiolipin synthase-like enzyme
MGIDVTFLEQGGQQPAEVAGLLADFLGAARTSLHLAIYDFRLGDAAAGPVVRALRERAAAGVDVRIAYDAGKPGTTPSPTRGDPAPPGTADFIARLGPGIGSRPITGGDPRQPKLMHQKYAVRDGGTAAGAVWTGSSNWTEDSWSLQENNLLRIDSPDLCRYYETDFAELWQRGDIASTGENDTGTVPVNGASVQVAFAPGEGEAIDHAIARLIATARRRVTVCSMLLTSTAILHALQGVLRAGRVEYGGLYDRTQMAGVREQWRAGPSAGKIPLFEEVARPLAGKDSTPYTPGGRHDFMHNKVLVADDTVVTGSFNLSHSATQNAENVLLLHSAELAQRYQDYAASLVRRYQGPAENPHTTGAGESTGSPLGG